jgi:hypothetical protein
VAFCAVCMVPGSAALHPSHITVGPQHSSAQGILKVSRGLCRISPLVPLAAGDHTGWGACTVPGQEHSTLQHLGVR